MGLTFSQRYPHPKVLKILSPICLSYNSNIPGGYTEQDMTCYNFYSWNQRGMQRLVGGQC